MRDSGQYVGLGWDLWKPSEQKMDQGILCYLSPKLSFASFQTLHGPGGLQEQKKTSNGRTLLHD